MVKIAQQYAKATQSSNLKSDEHHFETDKLAAMALSGGIGNLLFRVKYASDVTSYNALLESWTAIVIKKAGLRQWPKHITPQKVASKSLAYWLNDVCEECTGRGFQQVTNTPILSETECKVCRGTTKKPLACEANWRVYIEDMVDELNGMAAHAGARAMKKLASEIKI